MVELEPGEERAHLELMRLHARRGDRHAALRQFERMDRALRNELGVQPSREAFELREQLIAHAEPAPQPEVAPIGRSTELSVLRETLADVAEGRGRVVIVSGPPGIGKSMLLGMVLADAATLGWRVGSGVAAAVEGAWPYAPVLDTLADLCRRHPTLLDGLADSYREEIDRALAGVPTPWTAETGHQRLFVAVAELRPPGRRPARRCSSSSTTSTRRTRPACGCSTTSPGRRSTTTCTCCSPTEAVRCRRPSRRPAPA